MAGLQRGPSSSRVATITTAIDTAPISIDPTDGQLIAATANRDASAFGLLVDRYSASLYALAYRMLYDAAEAEDVVQDAMIRLWDHAATWQQRGGGVPAWLRRITTHLCLDRLRRRRFVADVEPPDVIDDTPGADRLIDRDRLGRIAHQALQSLNDRQRAAVVLTYYEELSNADAAGTLGMNIKAFESLLLRARAALREAVRAIGVFACDLGEQA